MLDMAGHLKVGSAQDDTKGQILRLISGPMEDFQSSAI
jgi:hypothetical protein